MKNGIYFFFVSVLLIARVFGFCYVVGVTMILNFFSAVLSFLGLQSRSFLFYFAFILKLTFPRFSDRVKVIGYSEVYHCGSFSL
jgi:hypothetical protein